MILNSRLLLARCAGVLTLLTCFTLSVGQQRVVFAQAYTPPTQVLVTMYRLNDAGYKLPGNPLCIVSSTETNLGCTANPSKPYPFTSNPATIEIDGPSNNNSYTPAQRYLWDVVAKEYGIQLGSQGNKPLSGVKAQAIASRTFTFQRIKAGYTIDNSNTFHVFAPYNYEVLLTQQAQRDRLIQAMQDRRYLTTAASTDPIEALYGADNMATTTQGNQTYLKSVADPVSARYGCWNGATNDPSMCGTSFGGMSSKGASRWSFGHTSSIGSVVQENPLYPADTNGLGNFWTIRLDSSEQILSHYYTGIHVRSASNVNTVITPAYRWVPLLLDIPSIACLNQSSFWVTIWFQNSGIQNWDFGGSEKLQFTVTYLGNVTAAQNEASLAIPSATLSTVTPGSHVQLPFPFNTSNFTNGQGRYRIRFDMYRNGQSFTSLAAAEQPAKTWYPYDIEIQVYNTCRFSYLPTLQSSTVVNQ
jgi:hypothetical protein